MSGPSESLPLHLHLIAGCRCHHRHHRHAVVAALRSVQKVRLRSATEPGLQLHAIALRRLTSEPVPS